MEVKQIYSLVNDVTGEILGKTDILKEDLSNVVEELKRQGMQIKRVSVGLNANDLYDELIGSYETSKTDLLEQYPWDGYKGDADERKGQAILYKDSSDIKIK